MIAELAVSTLLLGVGIEAFSLPPSNTSWDYQLGGGYAPADDVRIVAVDRTDEPFEGLYNICYLNGFQTQAEEKDFWMTDLHRDLLLKDSNGDLVEDPNWPGEYILDIRSCSKRGRLSEILGRWMEQCKRDGFDAVEIDNMDTYSRAPGISKRHAVKYMRVLASLAHQHDLAIAHKNALELLDYRLRFDADFAIVEKCNQFNECQAFVDRFGSNVLAVEYEESAFVEGCQSYAGQFPIILRDQDLVEPTEDTYVYKKC